MSQMLLKRQHRWYHRVARTSIAILWMLIAFPGLSLMAQESTITVQGKITDAHGAPSRGACVAVAGSTTGTTPHDDGHYRIEVAAGASLRWEERRGGDGVTRTCRTRCASCPGKKNYSHIKTTHM